MPETSDPRAAGESTGAAAPRRPRADRPRRRSRLNPWVRTLLEFLVAVVVIALLQGFIIKAYQIPSASMEQTLMTGDRILVDRLESGIERSRIVVFEHGDTWADTRRTPSPSTLTNIGRWVGTIIGLGPSTRNYTVKRIIGLGGERVACCDLEGRVTVDGVGLEEEHYLGSNFDFEPGTLDCSSSPRSLRCFPELLVPEGQLFLLGDNRANSADSTIGCRGLREDVETCGRFITEDQVIGRVVARFWPPSHIGRVELSFTGEPSARDQALSSRSRSR
ncbi:MAG: signal peptidase I [Actinomycetia bacterium]|nr:signal peptidase I [Actinomycetes bacterium]